MCLYDREMPVSQGPDRLQIIAMVNVKRHLTGPSRCRAAAQQQTGLDVILWEEGSRVQAWVGVAAVAEYGLLGLGRVECERVLVVERETAREGTTLCPMGAGAEPTKGPFIRLASTGVHWASLIPAHW